MTKSRSVKATYSPLAESLFGTPAAARDTVEKILRARSTHSESFSVQGHKITSQPAAQRFSDLISKMKKK